MDRIAKVARSGASWTPRHTEETIHAITPKDQRTYNHGYGAGSDDNLPTWDENEMFYSPLPNVPSQPEKLLGPESVGKPFDLIHPAALLNDFICTESGSRGRKRSYQQSLNEDSVATEHPLTRHHSPDHPPHILTRHSTQGDAELENPYASDNGSCGHPHVLVRCGGVAIGQTGRIVLDGFIKANIRFNNSLRHEIGYTAKIPLRYLGCSNSGHLDESSGIRSTTDSIPREIIRPPPPRFGDVRIDGTFEKHDRYLFKFFTQAVCNGRTVVTNDNAYLNQIAPMADKCPAVRHAMLSVSLSYILDYTTKQGWRQLATHHYQQAVRHVSQELRSPKNYSPGNGDTLIASLILLGHTEIVVWDRDQENMKPTNNEPPKWYRGAKLAERLLTQSDPAINYHCLENAQVTQARSQLAIRVCLDSVLSDCVHPLDPSTSIDHYNWLIRGTERERRRIDGFAGLSPDLMHYLAKVTYLASMRVRSPSSMVQKAVARQIQKILHEFRQWSALSDGYNTFKELLDSCELDGDNKVCTGVKVTELIGESYVAAAQIYLQCRVFRRQRDDSVVKELLDRLILTLKYQPTSGPLFTAQTPLFAVFIGGLVAYEQHDRRAIGAWFDPICEGPRENVPPAYEALKHAWRWLDDYERRRGKVAERAQDGGVGESGDDSEDEEVWESTDPWWEKLVKALTSKCGRINLC
ncbi:fungal-specific transcription factor domain-containing protein [Triangularia setosa]|uniref:Fungal-specific transcription factor domain-containing protein n=1 Tax=Triangularia setosa TaxID=2587417 RepID=A0AAN6VXJ8_9PEZI|nr:fungal-specific transcription factor domain-containing protein [Podospora setosa]